MACPLKNGGVLSPRQFTYLTGAAYGIDQA
jgi:hypothetical protein